MRYFFTLLFSRDHLSKREKNNFLLCSSLSPSLQFTCSPTVLRTHLHSPLTTPTPPIHLSNTTLSTSEDMHVFVEAGSQASMDVIVDMIKKLSIPVEEESDIHKITQLRELAEKNQLVKEKKSY
ncbi:uncharacterized protein A4U43_C03F22630 [Asparagus officinalis]|uniref:Uncharacterized protein n=1 Tax=Asparagus officinalis TaxID=4686 RepID=A0A5P1FC78_ASPOF|nr:uncharacterized protein A4U43_C03F22630 [Asparagus officinalis]